LYEFTILVGAKMSFIKRSGPSDGQITHVVQAEPDEEARKITVKTSSDKNQSKDKSGSK
jgi:hypothetical protein